MIGLIALPVAKAAGWIAEPQQPLDGSGAVGQKCSDSCSIYPVKG